MSGAIEIGTLRGSSFVSSERNSSVSSHGVICLSQWLECKNLPFRTPLDRKISRRFDSINHWCSSVVGAACGSTTASTGIFTKIGLPEMLKFKHDKRLSAGAIAASGTLAILIPPSTILVFYGILTEQSIGKLLVAGILPGIVSAGLYLLMIVIKCSINPNLAPKMTEQVSLREKFQSLKGLWTFPLLVVVVIGGIYTGIFTATESAAFGAFTAFLIVLFTKRGASGKVVLDALLETSRTTAMIFLIIIGAMLFSRFLAISRVPTVMAEWIMSLEANRMVILSAFLILYIFLGMFLDALGMLAITIPVVSPLSPHSVLIPSGMVS